MWLDASEGFARWWSKVSVTVGSCLCKTARASAHEAQYAGVAWSMAEGSPNPPAVRGRWARAMAAAGKFVVSRSCARHAVMDASCCCAN